MVTPAGQECDFYYEDFHRGHSTQECRLIQRNLESREWRTKDCATCPVPVILQANSSPDLVLEGTVVKGFMGFNRHIKIKASCSRHLVNIPEPQVGCAQCAMEKPGLKDLFGGG